MGVLRLLFALPLVVVLAAPFCLAPTVDASTTLNRAEVVVGSNESAAAVCQLIVLVNAIIVLELEDGLGLVASRADDVATLVLPPAPTVVASRAACDVTLGKLRVVRSGAEARPPATSWVFGPPAAVGDAAASRAGALRIEQSGSGSAVAVCQRIVLVDSVVIGGGAFGLPVGRLPGTLDLAVAPPRASASCSVNVGSVETSA